MIEAHRRRRDPGDGPHRPHPAVGARHGRLQGAGPRARGRAARWSTTPRRSPHAGCFAIVLEGVPDEVARMVTDAVDVPTIGIGAGPPLRRPGARVPRRARHRGPHHAQVRAPLRRRSRPTASARSRPFADDVRSGRFPADEESYHLARRGRRGARASTGARPIVSRLTAPVGGSPLAGRRWRPRGSWRRSLLVGCSSDCGPDDGARPGDRDRSAPTGRPRPTRRRPSGFRAVTVASSLPDGTVACDAVRAGGRHRRRCASRGSWASPMPTLGRLRRHAVRVRRRHHRAASG